MSSTGPRLRFAPSPTGTLHVGNARTALVNWLVAHKEGGSFVLRVEDTDVERSEEASEATILEDLRWLGLDWDEGPGVGGPSGPYRQSERLDLYSDATRTLLETGHVYPCFRSPEEIDEMRQQARAAGEPFRFRGEHRDLSTAEAIRIAEEGDAALRFRVPDEDVRFVDGLRGETGLAAGEIDDFVVARADGTPTYNFAVVVDDHAMAITQVIRGEDHLTNTPRQLLLYGAFGWEPPAFTHLALVLGPDRSRLSKRHGATGVAEMRRAGILPQALCNFLALLGWSPPDEEEVLALPELLAAYDVHALSPANAIFDATKLEWLNGQHIARLKPAVLVGELAPFFAEAGLHVPGDGPARDWWEELVELVRVGRRRLDEFAGPTKALLYLEPESLDAAASGVFDQAEVRAGLQAFAVASRAGLLSTESGFLETVDRVRDTMGVVGKQLFYPLRLAITGEKTGPELKRLVPLLDQGAACDLDPRVASVAERIDAAIDAGSRRA